MRYYYILEGKNVKEISDVRVWGSLFEKANRHVGNDKIGEVKVSTVFLGIDHNFNEGIPILFETMVFGGKFDQEQELYSTYEEAELGHDKWVNKVKENIGGD